MLANSKLFVTVTRQAGPVKVKALLDSGNNTSSGVVISERLHNQLQCSFLKLGGKVLGAGNQILKVKGVSTPIKLKLDTRIFVIKPLVIEGLTDPVNIGRSFMKKYGLTPHFGQQDLMISEGKEVEMIKTLKEPAKPSSGRGQKRD